MRRPRYDVHERAARPSAEGRTVRRRVERCVPHEQPRRTRPTDAATRRTSVRHDLPLRVREVLDVAPCCCVSSTCSRSPCRAASPPPQGCPRASGGSNGPRRCCHHRPARVLDARGRRRRVTHAAAHATALGPCVAFPAGSARTPPRGRRNGLVAVVVGRHGLLLIPAHHCDVGSVADLPSIAGDPGSAAVPSRPGWSPSSRPSPFDEMLASRVTAGVLTCMALVGGLVNAARGRRGRGRLPHRRERPRLDRGSSRRRRGCCCRTSSCSTSCCRGSTASRCAGACVPPSPTCRS